LIINKLVEKGNTVIVIEHNTDVIRSADWIIDLGPDGGAGGGEVLYEGIPNGIFVCERSITAKYL
jgi:excinuclease UvrABC ATPase subunit